MKSRLAPRLFAAAVLPVFAQGCHSQTTSLPPAHVVSRFHFTVAAPFSRVSAQFGPEAERAWGDNEWNPKFLYPQPGKDVEGAVFTVPHGHSQTVWVNTRYDPAGGRMQYVYLLADAMVCVIDVNVTATDAMHTAVDVTYTRTALTSEHSQAVARLAQKDEESGPLWHHYVDHALGLDHARQE